MSDPDVRQMEDYMSRPEETDADIIEQLQEENKALKETLDIVTKQKNRLFKGMELYTTKEDIEKYLTHYQASFKVSAVSIAIAATKE